MQANSLKTLCLATALLASVGALLLSPGAPAHASSVPPGYVPLAPLNIPGENDAGIIDATQKKGFYGCTKSEVDNGNCLPKYLATLYNLGIALAGLFLVFSIVRGGFTLLFTDSILGKLEGKKIMLQAAGGFIIVAGSFLLMNTINPQLGEDLDLSLKFKKITVTEIVDENLIRALSQAEVNDLIAETRRNYAEEKKTLNKKIAEFEAEKTIAAASGDTREVERLDREINKLKLRTAELNKQSGLLEAPRMKINSFNAVSYSKVRSTITDAQQDIDCTPENIKAGKCGIKALKDAFTEYRDNSAVKTDQSLILTSYGDEFAQLSDSRRKMASGLIETMHRDLKARDVKTFYPPDHPMSGTLRAENTTLSADVAKQVNAIKSERDLKLIQLREESAGTPALIAKQNDQIKRINDAADASVGNIKELCRVRKFDCKDIVWP